jgi:hypothetical protein
MILTLLLVAAIPPSDEARRAVVGSALAELNNYVEAIGMSDACLHRRDGTALEPLRDRIEQARRRAVAADPALAGTEAAGDTDYACRRTSGPHPVSRRAIRREATRLVANLEAVLDGAKDR